MRDDGTVLQRSNLTLPASEAHFWVDLLPFANGDALVVFESTLCDVSHDVLTVQRVNSKGETIWQRQSLSAMDFTRPPEKWFVAPDGNLLGYTPNKVWKLEATTGNVIWQAPLTGAGTAGFAVSSMILLPGTEDFIAVGNPAFQVWRKNSGSTPTYTITKQLSQTGSFMGLTMGPDGWVYFKEFYPNPKILRMNADLTVQALPFDLEAAYFAGFALGMQHLYVFDRVNEQNRFRRFDLQGKMPKRSRRLRAVSPAA